MDRTDEIAFWETARRQILLDPRKINLNSGTLFPTPKPVLEAADVLRQEMATNPSDFVWRRLPGLIQTARASLAQYLRCDPTDLLLLPNVTYAISIISASLKLEPGSEILTTDHEYGAMLNAWHRRAQRDGLTVKEVQLPYLSEDPQEYVNAFDSAITDQTRAIFLSHATCITGLALPAREICDLARKRGVLSIIDGAHAPGMIPVDLSQIGADFYAANCHKWIMAPLGAGFMHVARERRSLIEPLVTSWGWNYDPAKADEDSGNGGSRWQWDMEFHGSADRCPQMAIPAAFQFRKSLGGDEVVMRRMRSISDHARKVIDLPCTTPINPQLSCPGLTSFDLPSDDVVKTRDRLWHEHDVECPVTRAAGKTFLRISTAWFNTVEEIDRLATAVRSIR